MKRVLAVVAAVLVLVVGPVAACTAEAPVAAPAVDLETGAAQYVWEQLTSEDRRSICWGLDTFGEEWVLASLAEAYGPDAHEVHWDSVLAVINGECS